MDNFWQFWAVSDSFGQFRAGLARNLRHSARKPTLMPTKGTRTDPMREMMHFCNDFTARRFLPRHINHLPKSHTTQLHASSRSRQCGNIIAQLEIKKIYIMEIPQSQTECSLSISGDSISGATDYCTTL